MLAAILSAGLIATPGHAQDVQAVAGPTPYLPLEHEPPPKLFVDPPIPHRLAKGAVIIPYRTENIRVLPVLGPAAVSVSPRVGHLHVTLDDLPWHWTDAGDTNTIVIVGLAPGEHKVLVELADPTHRVITGKSVTFTVPAAPSPQAVRDR
jgi:hypothetical protein